MAAAAFSKPFRIAWAPVKVFGYSCRWEASANPLLTARIVGFHLGDHSKPIVLVDGINERVMSDGSQVAGAALSFNQKVYVEKTAGGVGETGFRIISVEGLQKHLGTTGTTGFWSTSGAGSSQKGRAMAQYGAITRGANNVGLYAWASRRERLKAQGDSRN
ncbi:unnamed protein product [Polarella glacialis]|uniref:Uncharacterized protein n=1 Tax=Polarella glacialis TaxID=89957 RepID=A0A813DR19_POLGL|nr:unnamed protein product [Polarella glacialis]CAE8627330.1 unnamed protein product [Polarella glacialis]